ncbi:MAG: hypothetical protein ACLPX8_11980, partial [Bryobacteraceae bacterium]
FRVIEVIARELVTIAGQGLTKIGRRGEKRNAHQIQRQEPEDPTHPLFMVGQAAWPVREFAHFLKS